MTTKLYPVILCGGSGTRLWPKSREFYPKQLLSFGADEDSLLQTTVKRLTHLDALATANKNTVSTQAPILVSNESHRFLVAEQLRSVGVKNSTILLEPVGRNTAPAIAIAAQHILKTGKDGLMMVMAADHIIKNEKAFAQAVLSGIELAQHDYLVTFGIVPTQPETGYGYIKRGSAIAKSNAAHIGNFVEKPDQATAEQYVKTGEYLWNSGMFLFKASALLKALGQFRADIAQAAIKSYDEGKADVDFYRVDSASFAACPGESIDYAVMEHVTENQTASEIKGAVIPLDAQWSDVGSWLSLWEVSEKDANGNLLHGDVVLHETTNSVIMADHRVVAGIDLKDIIIVETADAVMVAPMSSSQNVKKIVTKLKEKGREEVLTHRKVYRPWGTYEGVDNGARFQVKHILVNPGARLSLQMHHHRAEHWIVVHGTAKVTRGEETFLLSENESTYIPLGVKHRLENPGSIPLEIVEVQSGSYLGEDDIVRFDDIYGRQDKT